MIFLFRNFRIWFLMLGLMLSSCSASVIELTEQGKTVELLPNPEKYPGCVLLDSVSSTALVSSQNSYQQAMNKMRNTSAAMGVTHLSIDRATTRVLVTTIRARGFKCVHLETTQKTTPATPESWIFVD